MFKLCKQLDTEVEIEGIIYQVDTSFDNIMSLIEMMEHPTLTDAEKVYYGIHALLDTELDLEPEKLVKVFEALIVTFIHGGEEQEVPVDLEGNTMPVAKSQKNYDLAHDATYIYSSFKQAYGMNLFEQQGKLDWREFKVLLRDLPDETKFKQVIDIRTRSYPKGKGMGEERRKLKELKRTFALPGTDIDE